MSKSKITVWIPIVSQKSRAIQHILETLDQDSSILSSESPSNPTITGDTTVIDLIIIAIDSASLGNTYLESAIKYARKNHIRILPIILDSDIDFSKIPVSINSIQWLELWDPATISKGVERMLRSIKTDYEHLERLRVYDKAADAWLNEKETKDLLLRGNTLTTAEAWLAQAESHFPRPNELIQLFISKSREYAEAIQRRNQRILKIFWSIIGVGTATSFIMAILIFQDTLQIREDEREADKQKLRTQEMIEYLVAELDDPLIELEQSDILADIVTKADAYISRVESNRSSNPEELAFLNRLKRHIAVAREKSETSKP